MAKKSKEVVLTTAAKPVTGKPKEVVPAPALKNPAAEKKIKERTKDEKTKGTLVESSYLEAHASLTEQRIVKLFEDKGRAIDKKFTDYTAQHRKEIIRLGNLAKSKEPTQPVPQKDTVNRDSSVERILLEKNAQLEKKFDETTKNFNRRFQEIQQDRNREQREKPILEKPEQLEKPKPNAGKDQ